MDADHGRASARADAGREWAASAVTAPAGDPSHDDHVPDVDGGPGWVLDGGDLRPRIVDPDVFGEANADDPLLEAITDLWSGRPVEALRRLESARTSVRVRALRADCHRDLGHTGLATRMYGELIEEVRGTPSEAAIAQHYAKALAADGRDAQAETMARTALRLRREARAPEDLVASSEQAVRRIERWRIEAERSPDSRTSEDRT